MRTLLAPADLLVAPGTSVRYDVAVAGPESPVGPALLFDRPVEKARKITVAKKKANPTSDNTDPKPNEA